MMFNSLKRILGAWRAPAVKSSKASAENERGCTFLEQGDAEQARVHFNAALNDDETQAEVHSNLSSALNLLGHFEDAEQSSRAALLLDPLLAVAHVNLGNTMLYRGRYGEAQNHYEHALSIAPELPEANIHLALLGCPTPYLQGAIHYFEEKLGRCPDSYIALVRLGLGYQATGDLDAAREKFELAKARHPELAGPWASLASIYGSQGCPEYSLALFKTALAINENPIWRSAYLFFLQYSDLHSATDIYREHVSWGERHASWAESHPRFANTPTTDRQLRIAYISGDFFRHPVANFLEPILRCHDRSKFRVHCYANVLTPDEVTDRLRALSDDWLDTAAMSDTEVCQKIRDDGIDILIDLSGHTRGHRMGVLARKAAPLQITYLGYPGTTGLATVDYRISDSVCDPAGVADSHHTEKLLRLDGCFVTYLPPPDAPPVSPAPFLTRGHITFGSFNSINKVNRRTIRLWSEVLRAVPNSRMTIKHFAIGHKPAQQRILGAFAEYGIDADRLILLSAHPDIVGHLDMYRQVDIALDCTPYNGTTTTCEAMWMGVPVIALAGDRHSARVGASLLGCVGLAELVAPTATAYIATAAELAANGEYLRSLRQTLRSRLRESVLMNASGFTTKLENAYRTVWQDWCRAAGH